MPMGNPLSPTIADIVLDKLLDEAIAELKTMGITFKFITKYVDDIFAVIKKSDKEIILTTLNNFHPKIKFTYEEELDHKLPYLDIEIIKRDNNLIFNWYSKDISSGRLINFHSSQPMSQKLGTVKNFIKKNQDILAGVLIGLLVGGKNQPQRQQQQRNRRRPGNYQRRQEGGRRREENRRRQDENRRRQEENSRRQEQEAKMNTETKEKKYTPEDVGK
ncbi:uncharacterized protein LOC119675817 [Teleopsis dalmanni]|uniref:uncharacterized protein LOC119675817 n=1 Tax=Teleopsis dalmanni TaxID=139649 RepID=UPI0018CCC8C7|nr:uncharacterized protein LOC119675817 [Teleopsis dalmanni]